MSQKIQPQPLGKDFQSCQLCGFTNQDICYFRMWQECDQRDNPIVDALLITCKEDACFARIEADPRLYVEIPWSRGGPGKFMLLCGDCEHRSGFTCKNPKLKANGGDGLEVKFTNTPFSSIRIHLANGNCIHPPGPPATFCEGNPLPRWQKDFGGKSNVLPVS